MCKQQLQLPFEKYTPQQLIDTLASRPRMKWQWILKAAQRHWISEYVSDNAARRKQRMEQVRSFENA